MMVKEKEHVKNANDDVLTDEDIRYLKVAISLALMSSDILEMPKTKVALNELYDKIERMQGNEDQLFRGRLKQLEQGL